jgi:hypothetical protein
VLSNGVLALRLPLPGLAILVGSQLLAGLGLSVLCIVREAQRQNVALKVLQEANGPIYLRLTVDGGVEIDRTARGSPKPCGRGDGKRAP